VQNFHATRNLDEKMSKNKPTEVEAIYLEMQKRRIAAMSDDDLKSRLDKIETERGIGWIVTFAAIGILLVLLNIFG